ncbi:MAG: hypothetical protein RBT45_02620 [Acholeplasmataceae bacterium]|jgi:hypothetical protein|nr:hypothetical protein [Acholeplasmataceae bacterium]
MKKIFFIIVTILMGLTLVGCVGSGKEISELEARIEELEDSLTSAQSALEDVMSDLEDAIASQDTFQERIDELVSTLDRTELQLQEALANQKISQDILDELEASRKLIEELYDQLEEATGIDYRLLLVVQKQKDAIIGVDLETPENVSFNGVGSGQFGRILSVPKLFMDMQIKPFVNDEEWQDIQLKHYEMLEEIVKQGYKQDEVVNMNEFTFQQELTYYGIDIILNETHFIQISLDGNETLFSRVLTYDVITLLTIKVKTVRTEFVDNRLELLLVIQEFDNDEQMISLYVEDFKEGIGLVQVSYGPEGLYKVSYTVGINVREDLNAISILEYNEFGLFSQEYRLSYISNNVISDEIRLMDKYEANVSDIRRMEQYLEKENLSKKEIVHILSVYNIRGEDYWAPYYGTSFENNLYVLEEGNTLSIDMVKLQPLLDLYETIWDFYISLEDPNNFEYSNSIGAILEAYEYNGITYKFVTETGDPLAKYEFVTSEEDLENLGFMKDFLYFAANYYKHQELVNPIQSLYLTIYSVDEHLTRTKYVQHIYREFSKYVSDILTVKYETRAVLNLKHLSSIGDDFIWNQESLLADMIDDNDTTRTWSLYLNDYLYLRENINLFLDSFPSYHTASEDSIVSILTHYDVLFYPND